MLKLNKNIILALLLVIFLSVSGIVYFMSGNWGNKIIKETITWSWNNLTYIENTTKKMAELKKEFALYKQEKEKTYMDEISKWWLNKSYDLFKLQDIYNIAGEKAFSWYFDKPKFLDPEKNRILQVRTIKWKWILYYTKVKLNIENFLLPYPWDDLKDGKIRVFLIGKDLKRKLFIDDLNKYIWVDSIYWNYNTELSLSFSFLNEQELINMLKYVENIEIEGTNTSAYHSKNQNFSFKFPVRLLLN